MTLAALMALTIAAMIYTLAGIITFMATFDPTRSCPHDISAVNARLVLGFVGLWVATALTTIVLALPMTVTLILQLAAFVGMGTVIWQQVSIVRRSR